MHGAVGWKDNETECITMNNNITRQTQLSFNHFIIPTNAHNVKNVELLKHIKIMEAAPTCFGLQGNHHQGATAST